MKIKIISFLAISIFLLSCSIERKGMKYENSLKSLPSRNKESISPEDMELLKNRNVVFFFKENDTDKRANIEKAIKEIWSFTPIEFAYYSERSNYPPDLYAYFTIEGILTGRTTSLQLYFYLSLTVKQQTENNKRNKAIYYGKQSIMTQSALPKRDKQSHGLIEAIYNNNEIPNWNATILQAYLLEIQGHLEENKRELIYDKVFNEESLDALKEDTLYIPDYALERRFPATGKKHDPKKLLGDYPYAYKIVSTEELNNRVSANKETYVFDYVISSQQKFIRIYNTKIGKVYQSYSLLFAFGLKASDFRNIYR